MSSFQASLPKAARGDGNACGGNGHTGDKDEHFKDIHLENN